MKPYRHFCFLIVLGSFLLSRSGEGQPPNVIENPEAYNCINHNTPPQDLNTLNRQYAIFLPGESLLQYIQGVIGGSGGNLGPLNLIVSGNAGDPYAVLLGNLTNIQNTLEPGVPLITSIQDVLAIIGSVGPSGDIVSQLQVNVMTVLDGNMTTTTTIQQALTNIQAYAPANPDVMSTLQRVSGLLGPTPSGSSVLTTQEQEILNRIHTRWPTVTAFDIWSAINQIP